MQNDHNFSFSGGPAQFSGLMCWRADDNVFFDTGWALWSMEMSDRQLEELCQFLEHTATTKKYTELKKKGNKCYIAFEEEDEGRRNFCIIDKNSYMVLTILSENLAPLAKYLRSEIK